MLTPEMCDLSHRLAGFYHSCPWRANFPGPESRTPDVTALINRTRGLWLDADSAVQDRAALVLLATPMFAGGGMPVLDGEPLPFRRLSFEDALELFSNEQDWHLCDDEDFLGEAFFEVQMKLDAAGYGEAETLTVVQAVAADPLLDPAAAAVAIARVRDELPDNPGEDLLIGLALAVAARLGRELFGALTPMEFRALREKSRLLQSELAEKLDVSTRTVSRIENALAKVDCRTADTLRALAEQS